MSLFKESRLLQFAENAERSNVPPVDANAVQLPMRDGIDARSGQARDASDKLNDLIRQVEELKRENSRANANNIRNTVGNANAEVNIVNIEPGKEKITSAADLAYISSLGVEYSDVLTSRFPRINVDQLPKDIVDSVEGVKNNAAIVFNQRLEVRGSPWRVVPAPKGNARLYIYLHETEQRPEFSRLSQTQQNLVLRLIKENATRVKNGKVNDAVKEIQTLNQELVKGNVNSIYFDISPAGVTPYARIVAYPSNLSQSASVPNLKI